MTAEEALEVPVTLSLDAPLFEALVDELGDPLEPESVGASG